MKNIYISSTFLCLFPLNLSFELNFNMSKVAYFFISLITKLLLNEMIYEMSSEALILAVVNAILAIAWKSSLKNSEL